MKKYIIINLIILALALTFSVVIGLFLIKDLGVFDASAAIIDKVPPKIFNSKIFDITATSSTITWQTDEQADSLVNYGLNKRYGMVRDPFFDKIEHTIVLDDLLPGTSYYFRIISADASGNQVISNDFTFITEEVEELKEEYQKEGKYPGEFEEPGEYPGTYDEEGEYKYPLMEEIEAEELTKILEMVERIEEEKILEVVERQIRQKAQEVVEPIVIIFDQVDVEVGTDYAIINWRTTKEANSIVALVTEGDFDSSASDPYVWEEGRYDEGVLGHRVEIDGLTPATTYHFQVSSETSLGLVVKSDDKVFTTRSILPEIYNISVTKVEEDSATFTFVTNVPCSSLIEYTDMDTTETRMEGNSNLATVHSVRLTNLEFDTYYSALITVENEYGEEAESSPLIFLTIKDEAAPVISKINTESTLYPGAENRVQTIISWETDELAICQLFYHQGLAPLKEVDRLPIEIDFVQKHVQVTTNLLPATVYKFWMECFDDVENKTISEDFIMLTPTREQNIIDIILRNFETTFGWVKGLTR